MTVVLIFGFACNQDVISSLIFLSSRTPAGIGLRPPRRRDDVTSENIVFSSWPSRLLKTYLNMSLITIATTVLRLRQSSNAMIESVSAALLAPSFRRAGVLHFLVSFH